MNAVIYNDFGNFSDKVLDEDVVQVNANKPCFVRTKASNINIEFCFLANSTFTNASFEYCHFKFCLFDNSMFNNTKFIHCIFQNCSLQGSEFIESDLSHTRFYNCNMDYCYFKDTINPYYYPTSCPLTGSFTAWKKAISNKKDSSECIIELTIPKNASRSSGYDNHCRCSEAVVENIIDIKTNEQLNEAYSFYNDSFVYRVGQTVKADSFNTYRFEDCTNGIHFFMDKHDALKYDEW